MGYGNPWMSPMDYYYFLQAVPASRASKGAIGDNSNNPWGHPGIAISHIVQRLKAFPLEVLYSDSLNIR